MRNLTEGSVGSDVELIQQALKGKGFDPGGIDGSFGRGTLAAVIAFQRSEGLVADGIVGGRTVAALGIGATPPDIDASVMTAGLVAKLFPETPGEQLDRNFALVLQALQGANLDNLRMILMALATIRAETGAFRPLNEFVSHFNTSPNGRPFDLYDSRRDLGNQGPDDGQRFRGRGFVQLTGRTNYTRASTALQLPTLLTAPETANDPGIAARILALYLGDRRTRIEQALDDRDFAAARRLVNGGSNGLDAFTHSYLLGEQLAAAATNAVIAAAGIA